MIQCTSCGASVGDTDSFCPNCGKSTTPDQSDIPNYLLPAILTTIFCCLPTGIVSIVYAAKVNGQIASGDLEGAKRSSEQAKLWAWVSFGIGIALFSIFVVLPVLALLSFDY